MRWLVSFMCWIFLTTGFASPFDDPRHLFESPSCEQFAYRLQYTSSDSVKEALSKSDWLSKPNWMYWDARLNTLVYCVMQKDKNAVMAFLQSMDKPVQQIQVGVKIVSVDEDWLEALGLQWNFNGLENEAAHSFLFLHASWGLKILSQISAKRQNEQATVVASPTLVTSNNQPAFIESGDKIPYQERNHEGDFSTEFKDALLRLSITPSILPKRKLRLRINLHYDKVSSFVVAGMPVIRAQQLQTDIVTQSGRLVVLGGIIESHSEREKEQVPFLSQIPLLGYVFHYHKQASGRKQLLIFLFPEIVQE